MTSTALATVAGAKQTEPVCPETVRRELERVRDYQRMVGYALEGSRSLGLYTLLTDLFMTVNSPRLEALTVELLEAVHQEAPPRSTRRRATFRLARSLHGMGLLSRAIPHRPYQHDAAHGADPEWAAWCERWLATSTLATRTRRSIYYGLLKAGRWLAEIHPTVSSPDAWSREVGLAYVVAVNGLAIGDLSAPSSWHLRPEESRSPRTTRSGCSGPSARFFAMRRSGAGALGGSIPIESLPPRGRSRPRLVRSHASSRTTSGRSFCGPVSISTRATYRPPGGTH